MSTFNTVNCTVANQVATIELNRPDALNAFNQQMREELLSAIHQVDADPEVRVVVIAGSGRSFCSGADLREGLAGHADAEAMILTDYKPILQTIHNSQKLYLAAVQGAAAGIGSALAMTCDLMIMAHSAYIYQAFSAIALVPDGGACWHLVNALGYKRALELALTAGKLPAERCVELGLANRAVADDELRAYTQQLAGQLSDGAPLAQRYTKELMQQAQRMDLSNMIDLEARRQRIAYGSLDFQEGVSAFMEKRKASFKGH